MRNTNYVANCTADAWNLSSIPSTGTPPHESYDYKRMDELFAIKQNLQKISRCRL